MRVLAIDFGSKRIGVAVGVDEPFPTATPHPALVPSGTLKSDAARIAELAERHEADAVVVGVPVHASDGRMARICRLLIDEIRALGHETIEVDESLTSVQAASNLAVGDFTAAERRKRLDGEAACLILERYFGQRKT